MNRFGGRMAHRLLYLPGVEKDIRALPKRVAERVRHGLERLAEDPRLGKPLHGELAPFWSYRVGDYRIVYEIRDEELVVLVVLLGHRREIYERARRKRN
jgi:mRNA interferase RelE/StbE